MSVEEENPIEILYSIAYAARRVADKRLRDRGRREAFRHLEQQLRRLDGWQRDLDRREEAREIEFQKQQQRERAELHAFAGEP